MISTKYVETHSFFFKHYKSKLEFLWDHIDYAVIFWYEKENKRKLHSYTTESVANYINDNRWIIIPVPISSFDLRRWINGEISN